MAPRSFQGRLFGIVWTQFDRIPGGPWVVMVTLRLGRRKRLEVEWK